MEDFCEIDFLNVESNKSGDAIPIRYRKDGVTRIHVTDGGFQKTGEKIVEHINSHYGNPSHIDAIIVTHGDSDHTGGLRILFDEFTIGELWMLRPWKYAAELLDNFKRFTSVAGLEARLKESYPNLLALEELANKYNVPIRDPFQGAIIGDFNVLSPSKQAYLDLVVASDKTPEATNIADSTESIFEAAGKLLKKAVDLIASPWGYEVFPADDTSPDNNMSVVQFAYLCGNRILLTGDAGRAALNEAADYAPNVGLFLPGVDLIQVLHHGSRHNVSSEVLDRWLGPKQTSHDDRAHFSAIVSASKEDEHHPRKAVVRAFRHRGAIVKSTEDGGKAYQYNIQREGWTAAPALDYPFEQEA
ncbi:MBL fold metallo-hydrolase [Vibrio parahaemolyticus]|nr:MBL fold metallo-hydrolase [Vibrio parahaemolyticus]